MSETLLPCPFCGGEATISDGGYSGEKFLARCRELSCPAASGFIRKTHDEAVAAWNRRSDAVPVVRCGECEAYQPTEGGKPFCVVHQIAVCKNDYCSRGAKMESEDST